MARIKATVTRLAPPAGSNFQQRTIYPFKIKELLPQQKTVDIKKRTNCKDIQCKKKIKVFQQQK